jgi:hypothetical protein
MIHASFIAVMWFTLVAPATARPDALSGQQEPRSVVRETAAVSGVVEDVDRVGRTVTIKPAGAIQFPIYVGPDLPIFEQLNRGDVVTIRYYDSLIVAVTPNARMEPFTVTTADAQKELDRDDAKVTQQVRMVVTVDAIDIPARLVTYHAADNRRVLRPVQNLELLEGLKVGDVVTLTYTKAHAASIEKRQ